MSIPYHTRRRLRRIGLVLLTLLLLTILAWFCWVVWLERYVVYTREGVALDFSFSSQDLVGEVAVPPGQDETIPIYYNEGANALNLNTEMTQLVGYYIDVAALTGDISGVREDLAQLEPGTPVMIDLKNVYGGFLYTSSLPDALSAGTVDTTAVDALIQDMTSRNLYLIARIPAFKDRNYGLNHVSSGLPLPQGYLWADSDGCYWLKPTDNGTLSWIKQIVEEIKEMGFDEVVLSHFYFPDSQSIVYRGNKDEDLATAATYLVNNCSSDSFTVSFGTTNPAFVLPEGRCRLYLENVDAKSVGAVAAQVTVPDPMLQLVFVSNTNDTRFNDYSVLRPLSAAEVLEAQKTD